MSTSTGVTKKPATEPAQIDEAAAERKPRRVRWRAVQFGLAALAATPLLFIGGIDGWPWQDDAAGSGAAAAKPFVAGEQADPVRVQLERLGIDAPIDALGVDADTKAVLPPAAGRLGWREAGPEPGEPGRAVVLGRVASAGGPDVFAGLSGAREGDRIVVTTADGTAIEFVVRSVETFPSAELPRERVELGPMKEPQIRLLAPAGENEAGKGFSETRVVFADLAPQR